MTIGTLTRIAPNKSREDDVRVYSVVCSAKGIGKNANHAVLQAVINGGRCISCDGSGWINTRAK